jgi:Rrf2 family protein
MKLITRNTDYAIRVLILMAKEKRFFSVREISLKLKMPHAFLRRILQILHKKNILKGYKGKGGGFLLEKKPKEIKILELIRIFQGELKLNECLFKKSLCPNVKKCPLKRKLDRIERYVISKIKEIDLESLMKDG